MQEVDRERPTPPLHTQAAARPSPTNPLRRVLAARALGYSGTALARRTIGLHADGRPIVLSVLQYSGVGPPASPCALSSCGDSLTHLEVPHAVPREERGAAEVAAVAQPVDCTPAPSRNAKPKSGTEKQRTRKSPPRQGRACARSSATLLCNVKYCNAITLRVR